jgi:hypothetical protein
MPRFAARSLAPAVVLAAALAVPAAALGAAAGWSTPHTASAVNGPVYAAGPNGQGVELFGASGASQKRTAMLRAIKSDATEGTAVSVNAAGRLGYDQPHLAVNANGRIVAAYALDDLGPGPIGLAAALGARTALPKTATVLPTTGGVTAIAVAIGADGTGTVAWIESSISGTPLTTIKAATMRPGQPPVVAPLATSTAADALIENLAVGLDGSGRPIVTWTSSNETTGTPTAIGIARGTTAGVFAPTAAQQLTTAHIGAVASLVQASGALTVLWSEVGGAIRAASAPPGGVLGAPRTVASLSGSTAGPAFAGGPTGRLAVFYPTTSGLKVVLRSSSGTWGSARAVGPSGKRSVQSLQAGVDASGRVVLLWDDGPAGSAPTRILAARSSSSSNPPGAYSAVPQRSGDKNCQRPILALASSGDGLGSWLCNVSKSSSGQPRLARLTKPS